MRDPVDDFELGVFEHTADIELATEVGDLARWAVASTVESLATLGITPDRDAIAAFMFPGSVPTEAQEADK